MDCCDLQTRSDGQDLIKTELPAHGRSVWVRIPESAPVLVVSKDLERMTNATAEISEPTKAKADGDDDDDDADANENAPVTTKASESDPHPETVRPELSTLSDIKFGSLPSNLSAETSPFYPNKNCSHQKPARWDGSDEDGDDEDDGDDGDDGHDGDRLPKVPIPIPIPITEALAQHGVRVYSPRPAVGRASRAFYPLPPPPPPPSPSYSPVHYDYPLHEDMDGGELQEEVPTFEYHHNHLHHHHHHHHLASVTGMRGPLQSITAGEVSELSDLDYDDVNDPVAQQELQQLQHQQHEHRRQHQANQLLQSSISRINPLPLLPMPMPMQMQMQIPMPMALPPPAAAAAAAQSVEAYIPPFRARGGMGHRVSRSTNMLPQQQAHQAHQEQQEQQRRNTVVAADPTAAGLAQSTLASAFHPSSNSNNGSSTDHSRAHSYHHSRNSNSINTIANVGPGYASLTDPRATYLPLTEDEAYDVPSTDFDHVAPLPVRRRRGGGHRWI